MVENVERCGGAAVVVEDEWGKHVSLDKIEAALAAHPDAKVVAFVQAETSTGAHTPPQPLVALAHEHGCLTIVDTVTSVGGCPVMVDDWDIDVAYAGSQKYLSCPPGLPPASFGERALERVRERFTRCQSWFMDLNLLLGYGEYPARAPTITRRPSTPSTASTRPS
jgi:alanine-glyoxylate transaminase/serine-glyoxylate transaminase/serine-pyruvate transaminase